MPTHRMRSEGRQFQASNASWPGVNVLSGAVVDANLVKSGRDLAHVAEFPRTFSPRHRYICGGTQMAEPRWNETETDHWLASLGTATVGEIYRHHGMWAAAYIVGQHRWERKNGLSSRADAVAFVEARVGR